MYGQTPSDVVESYLSQENRCADPDPARTSASCDESESVGPCLRVSLARGSDGLMPIDRNLTTVFAQDYLSLRLVRLKPEDEWLTGGPGLFFLFIKGGSGEHVGGTVTHRLSAGDVLVLNAEARGKLSVPVGGEI